tara:strand:- start:460 stop:726 length:267 start_codon:yes stop_codon:yes gene_type:complete
VSVRLTIEEKLRKTFNPTKLNIVDESHLHAGHVGASPAGETHFRIEMLAEAFTDLSRVERQRIVYKILEEELKGPVHALSLSLSSPCQ